MCSYKGQSPVKLIFAALLVLMVALLCSGCDKIQGYIDFDKVQKNTAVSPEQPAVNGQHPLRIAFASVMSPKETRASYQEMVEYISKQLGQPAILIQRKTYEELNMLMAGGEADIAFFSTGAYVAYHGMTPIEQLAMVQTDGTIFYQAYLIVQADSDIYDFSQLRGKTFAFTDPLSYSGRLAIDYMLLDDYHTNAESFFQRCFYTYNHDKSLWAVANKLADGAGIDSQIYDFAKKTNPEMTKNVRIIKTIQSAPSGPVVMRKDLPEATKRRLQEIFYQMSEVPALEKAMQSVMIERFQPPEPHLYDELRSKYNQREKLAVE